MRKYNRKDGQGRLRCIVRDALRLKYEALVVRVPSDRELPVLVGHGCAVFTKHVHVSVDAAYALAVVRYTTGVFLTL